MVRLLAVLIVVIVAIGTWLTRSMWERDDSSTLEVARIPPSEELATLFGDALCRSPRDDETVKWDSRPFEKREVAAWLTYSDEGRRVGAIRQTYLKVLLRDPFPGDCAGVRHWVDRGLRVEDIERRLADSHEARRIGEVRQVFVETLGRDPAGWDTASLRRWVESELPAAEIRNRLATQRPLVGVHYFTWYQSRDGRWGNGSTAVGAEAPRPSLGLYDSGDVKVIDTHIAQMVETGFDFAIVQVIPQDPASWRNAHTFFQRLRGRPLRAALMLDNLYTEAPAIKADWVEKAKFEFTGYPNHLSHHDQPLMMLFASPLDFTVPGLLLRNVYWTNSYGPGKNTFNLNLVLYPHDWPFWAQTPQPLVNGVVPVLPGYIDSHLGRSDPMVHPRDNGRLYHEQWQHALAQKPELILVYSWNEHFEQSAIEPTATWGDAFLRWTKCYITHAHAGTAGRC